MDRALDACEFGGRRCAEKHSEDFQYCGLSPQKIRLLEIQKPGHKSPHPHFRLKHYYRNETPPYIALSYTWGDEDNPIEEIFINSRKKRVRPNLFQALYFLRGYHQFQYLWVDALCIDQDDVAERNEQVRNMHYTFRNAKLVVAWLGCLI